MFLACTLLNNILFYIALKLKTSALKRYITLAFCILVIDTRKQFQLQTDVFLKRPDVVTFDVYILRSYAQIAPKCKVQICT